MSPVLQCAPENLEMDVLTQGSTTTKQWGLYMFIAVSYYVCRASCVSRQRTQH